MGLGKKKYTLSEVEYLLERKNQEFSSKLLECSTKISELEEENKNLNLKISEYQDKEGLVFSAMKDSKDKSAEIENNTKLQYEMAVETLKSFFNKWDGYFDALSEKYPYYDATKKATDLRDKFKALLSSGNNKLIIDGLNNTVSSKEYNPNEKFDPKQKINDYIAATSDSGFNLEEVLNPGELQLEDLCKELGLMDEE